MRADEPPTDKRPAVAGEPATDCEAHICRARPSAAGREVLAQPAETAVCGPAYTVVWEGGQATVPPPALTQNQSRLKFQSKAQKLIADGQNARSSAPHPTPAPCSAEHGSAHPPVTGAAGTGSPSRCSQSRIPLHSHALAVTAHEPESSTACPAKFPNRLRCRYAGCLPSCPSRRPG